MTGLFEGGISNTIEIMKKTEGFMLYLRNKDNNEIIKVLVGNKKLSILDFCSKISE